MVPLGPGLCRAHRSSSVIGTGMQKPPVAQGPHGELVELSVTGGQELVAVAVADEESPMTTGSSTTATLHGAIVAVGSGSVSKPSDAIASEAVRPGPVGAPVSSSLIAPSDTRLKVNFGQTFKVESKVLAFIVIDPVEDL